MNTVKNQAGIEYGTYISMETIVCYKCAIPFGVPSNYKNHLRSSSEGFYCPNGHYQSYKTSTEEILKRKLEQLQKEKEQAASAYEQRIKYRDNLIETKKKENIALKSKHTKFKNRVANGVCPCCNRSFENLHNHMKTQHPEYKKNDLHFS